MIQSRAEQNETARIKNGFIGILFKNVQKEIVDLSLLDGMYVGFLYQSIDIMLFSV